MIRTVLALVAFVASVSAGTWKEGAPLPGIGLGLEFVSATVGYAAGAINGEDGQWLWTSHDSGKTWNQTAVSQNFGLSLCLAANGPNVYVGSLFNGYISHDAGKTFKESAGSHAQGQGCRYQNGMFYDVGAGLLWGDGVATSTTGDLFKGHNVTNIPAGMTATFGAFMGNTWYLTAGSEPQSDDDDNQPTKDDDDDFPPPTGRYEALARSLRVGEHGIYSGAILKSSDAGSTWEVQMSSENVYQMDMIDCADANTCCAAASGPTTGQIYCTYDGKTWDATWNSTTGAQMVDITSFGSGNWVASGTLVNDQKQTLRASILRSSDNGKTWTEDDLTSLPQIGVIDASYPSMSSGFLLGVDRFNSEILYYYS